MCSSDLVSLSLHYASPEQINGARPAPSMDIYSLGCVFYEMLSGEPPFTQGDILHQQLTRKPEPVVGISNSLNDLLQRCLEKEPARRPVDVEELQALLARIHCEEGNPQMTVRLAGGAVNVPLPLPKDGHQQSPIPPRSVQDPGLVHSKAIQIGRAHV